MNNSREIDYLKRKVKRTYKWYTGERTDGTATIADLAKLFKLPIDEENLSDYEVKSFDSKIPSIEILCKRDNSTYFAEYSGSSKLLGFSSSEVKFINISINYSDNLKKETTLSLWWDEIYCDKFFVKIDERYTLIYIRMNPNPYSMFSPEFTQNNIAFMDKDYSVNNFSYILGEIQARLDSSEIESVYLDDEYQYKSNTGIIYVSKESSKIIHGTIFCENIFKGVDEYIPISLPFEKDIETESNTLSNDQVYSAIFFYGIPVKLQIFKECTNFKIQYTKRNRKEHSNEYFEYLIPVLTTCAPIDYVECEHLESEIAEIIKDEEVLNKIQEKLKEIKFRLMVSKGIAKKKETVLSITKYSDIPFEEAMKLITENKDEIFAEIIKKLEKNASF